MGRMLRPTVSRFVLTYRQHRFEVTAVAILAGVLLAASLIEVARLLAIGVPAGCAVEPGQFYYDDTPVLGGSGVDCMGPQRSIHDVLAGPEFRVLKIMLELFPFLAGLALGAPLIARELEQGTAALSWSLSPSRIRWLLPRAAAMLLLLAAALAAVAVASDLLFTLSHPGEGAHASFEDYELRGVMVLGWGIGAFALAAALGALLSRTVPALIVAAVVCSFLVVSWDGLLARTLFVSVAAPQYDPALIGTTGKGGMPLVDMNWHPDYLYLGNAVYLDGKPFEGDTSTWWAQHPFTFDPRATAGADGLPPGAPDPLHTPQQVPIVLKGGEYWMVVRTESAVLIGSAAVAGAFVAFFVARRRPY